MLTAHPGVRSTHLPLGDPDGVARERHQPAAAVEGLPGARKATRPQRPARGRHGGDRWVSKQYQEDLHLLDPPGGGVLGLGVVVRFEKG